MQDPTRRDPNESSYSVVTSRVCSVRNIVRNVPTTFTPIKKKWRIRFNKNLDEALLKFITIVCAHVSIHGTMQEKYEKKFIMSSPLFPLLSWILYRCRHGKRWVTVFKHCRGTSCKSGDKLTCNRCRITLRGDRSISWWFIFGSRRAWRKMW